MVVSEGKAFYAYIHYKPDFTPFYVGKGRLKRAKSLKCRNQYYLATVGKYGAENIIIGKFACSTEANAFDLERGIIKCLKKAEVKLTNFTDGGEGASGRVATSETRAKISVAKMGKNISAETRAKMSAAKMGKTHSAETRAKLSVAHMGKTLSAETRAKMSAAKMGKTFSAEARAKMSVAHMGKNISAETRAKLSAAGTGEKNHMFGKTHSLETKIKISASQIGKSKSAAHRANMLVAQQRRHHGPT